MEKINVLIADDHNLFAKLVATLLKSSDEINVTGIASDGQQAIEMIETHDVDVVLLDINMPSIDGMQALRQLVEKYPKLKIIMLSSHKEAWLIQKSLKSGAAGYLTKSADDNEVLEAIMTVYNGGNYCCKDCLNAIMDNLTGNQINGGQGFQTGENQYKELTTRELEILKLIAREMTSADIANILSISPRTVETHRKNILQKLGVKNTVGLIKVAMEANLIKEEV